jgi:UvrB/UvrC motif-containing protein
MSLGPKDHEMSDLTDILNEWPYDPSAYVRKIEAEDGRELIQVRTPTGIEQYEITGRPDGLEPYGFPTMLEYAESQLEPGPDGSPGRFTIDADTAGELQHEGLLFYYRYLVCFQIGEYGVVVRDTARNLRMFDVLKAHCEDAEIVNASEQYRPYVMRMSAAARALSSINSEDYAQARGVVEVGIQSIERLTTVPTTTFEFEKERSLAILRGMLKAIPEPKEASPEDTLRQELDDAVESEDYERAATLRDRLRDLAGDAASWAHGAEG